MGAKFLLVIASIFGTLNLFSQTDKGAFLISINGSYVKSGKESGATKNQHVVQGKYLETDVSLGCFINEHFIAGLGIDYNWEKEERTSNLMINRYYQGETMNVKAKRLFTQRLLGVLLPDF